MKLHILLYTIIALLMPVNVSAAVTVGAARMEQYLPALEGKRVALYSNHTGVIPGDSLHLVDRLVAQGVDVRYIFSPEHGFRGTADAGAHVADGRDPRTGIPVLSLYGKGKKMALAALDSVDVVVTDIQDVGLRFYTYYCTLVEILNAAPAGVRHIILDRPNPTAAMGVDGPTLDMRYSSGVGSLPIPVLHGMTLGELMLMARGEGWLKDSRHPDIEVVPCEGWNHSMTYEPPIAPSPNLPNLHAILLYPSLCYFEATPVSVGRGTKFPFEVYGHPSVRGASNSFTFTPRPGPGSANPPCKGLTCRGRDLRSLPDSTLIVNGLNLEYLIAAYNDMGRPERFFTSFFELLVGDESVRRAIINGDDAAVIKARWKPSVEAFKNRRRPYLLYPER